jgi:hypothetical protein
MNIQIVSSAVLIGIVVGGFKAVSYARHTKNVDKTAACAVGLLMIVLGSATLLWIWYP